MTFTLRSTVRRAGLALVTGALATTGALAAPGAAQAAPADSGAGWLAGQLSNGVMHNAQFDFDDYGLTADTGYALIEVGGQASAVSDMRRALARNVDAWTTYRKNVYAGSVAKALVFAEEAPKARPRSFAGVDLVTRMENRTADETPIAGRIEDKGANDYSNTIGQAFAARGLAVAGSDEAPAGLDFLLQQQCSAGFFRLGLTADKTAADQGCVDGESTPDTDATSLAVLNLQAVPSKSEAVRSAIRSGLSWLASQQAENGSLGGGPSTESPNTNSTGLAAWALGQGGRCQQAADAARWVRDLQLDNGAIAYDRAAFRTANRDGIKVETRDQFRRATSQAAPGLAYARLATCQG